MALKYFRHSLHNWKELEMGIFILDVDIHRINTVF